MRSESLDQNNSYTVAPTGLTNNEVTQRRNAGLSNKTDQSGSRSIFDIIRANVFTLFNFILGLCILVILLVGSWQDATFGVIVIANMFIGVIQEYRAKRTLDKLSVLNAPIARVCRENETLEVAIETIVQDDLLILKTGDQIPADAELIFSQNLEVDESLLTGESDPISKNESDEVLSGSFVVSGFAKAQVIRVGADSFASKITSEAKRFSLVNSELRNSINKILLYITWILFPLIILVVNGQMQSRGGWQTAISEGTWEAAVVSSVASIVGMIPEGLVLLTSISFGLAAIQLARQKVLVQELPAVEGLARVDMICLDKTGTLTEGHIVLDNVLELGHKIPPNHWSQILAKIALDENANSTATALKEKFFETNLAETFDNVTFSSARKWSSFSNKNLQTEKVETWVFGAPEIVLSQQKNLDKSFFEKVDSLSKKGLRVLVLAYSLEKIVEEKLPTTLEPVILVSFGEKVRSDAKQTLEYFQQQNVSLRIISGDNPLTVAAVAREVGFLDNETGYDARNLPEDLDLLGDIVENNKVFGRVSPEQKQNIVKALQKKGRVVAMTGDGVNDALALKQADIGIAMGNGAAVTKAVARLVLLDGKFSHLPGVVAQGRRVIANIERVANLFLSKTVYAVLLAIFFGVALWKYPFLPRQLSIVSSLTIGIPAFFLALLPNKRIYKPGFLVRVLKFSVPAGCIVAASIITVYAYAHTNATVAQSQTAATITALCVALWILVVLARPFDRWRVILVLVMLLALVTCLSVPFLREFFALQIPNSSILLVTIGVVLVGIMAVEVLYRILCSKNVLLVRKL